MRCPNVDGDKKCKVSEMSAGDTETGTAESAPEPSVAYIEREVDVNTNKIG